MMTTKQCKSAKANEPLAPRAMKRLASFVRGEVPATVQPKSDAKHGQWLCCDCGEPFQNNMMAEGHSPKSHRLGWWTGTHVEEA